MHAGAHTHVQAGQQAWEQGPVHGWMDGGTGPRPPVEGWRGALEHCARAAARPLPWNARPTAPGEVALRHAAAQCNPPSRAVGRAFQGGECPLEASPCVQGVLLEADPLLQGGVAYLYMKNCMYT